MEGRHFIITRLREREGSRIVVQSKYTKYLRKAYYPNYIVRYFDVRIVLFVTFALSELFCVRVAQRFPTPN